MNLQIADYITYCCTTTNEHLPTQCRTLISADGTLSVFYCMYFYHVLFSTHALKVCTKENASVPDKNSIHESYTLHTYVGALKRVSFFLSSIFGMLSIPTYMNMQPVSSTNTLNTFHLLSYHLTLLDKY